jgi:tRNA A-37 threonylcarbamoyl transferase component Bud32
MNERERSGRIGVALLLGGVALGAAGLVLRTPTHPVGSELQSAADGFQTRVQQAILSHARAIEPRAADAAHLPEIVSALDLGADAPTFEDLLETEDWWVPFRSTFALSGLVAPAGTLALLGPTVPDLTTAPIVRQAREEGLASGILIVRQRVFLVAAARVTRGKIGPTGVVVVLGRALDKAGLRAIVDDSAPGTAGALAISDGKRLVESGGADALQPAVSALVGKETRGPVPFGMGRVGVAWPFEGSLWLLGVFVSPAAEMKPFSRLAPPFVAGGVVLLVCGLALLVVARRSRPGADLGGVSTASMPATGGGLVPFPDRSGSESVTGSAPAPQMPVASASGTGLAAAGAVAQAAHALEPPATTLGRYQLLERVGEGGMAEVFIAATHGAEGFIRHFVVKRMYPHLTRNRDAVNQFIDEARLQSSLIHSNVVPVYDFGKAGDEYFLAMEHIHGRDVERVVRRHVEVYGRPLSVPVAFHVMREVLEGLAYAHSRTDPEGRPMEIVHRDVAPGNILVSFRGEVKLTDFGIAKAERRVSRTEVGILKGNASFMSPEQARGESVDARSDLFSAGVVLYYCLTGQFLYGDGDAMFKRLLRAAAGPAELELEQINQIPPIAAEVIRKALAVDPAARYQTARDFARDLVGHYTGRRGELSDLMGELFPDQQRASR